MWDAMFKWSKLYPRMDYWSNPSRLNPSIDQNYCRCHWRRHFGTIGLIMVNMVKMVELLDNSLKGVIIDFLWSIIKGHL